MLSKEEISKLKINVFNQCDDETISLVAEMLKHTEQLEKELETYKDIKSIANTKMTELTQIKDIDKLKSENWILQNKLNKYESREQKLIEKLQEESNIHNENWKGVEIEKHSKEILEMLKKE